MPLGLVIAKIVRVSTYTRELPSQRIGVRFGTIISVA